MTKKTDRRSKKTQSAIKKAFEELLTEKTISEISITELTNRADIHRATFYLHYEDIYDLYHDYEMDIFNNLTKIFEDEKLDTYQSFYDALLDYIANTPTIVNLLHHNSSLIDNSTFMQNMTNYLINMCTTAWKNEWVINEISPELEYFAYYRIHGIMALIAHWLNTNCSMSLTDLKNIITKIDTNVDQFMMRNEHLIT